MNCFEWRNHSSDYIDGSLSALLKREADKHVEKCSECGSRFKHFQKIISALQEQNRHPLPVHLRKSPLALISNDETIKKSFWERTPWIIRTSAEGAGAAILILVVVLMVPRIRSMYERNQERRLDTFNIADQSSEEKTTAPQLVRGNLGQDSDSLPEDFAGEGDTEDASDDSDAGSSDSVISEGGIRVGNNEVWRFNFKTDSPHEIQPKIAKALNELNLTGQEKSIGGREVPGGIQFDIIVPKSAVPSLKTQLQKIAPQLPNLAQTDREKENTNSNFTWYKKRSQSALPAGKARVVIWLSQI